MWLSPGSMWVFASRSSPRYPSYSHPHKILLRAVTFSRWGSQQHNCSANTYYWQNNQLWPAAVGADTLWQEEAVICAGKRCGVGLFFQSDLWKVQTQPAGRGRWGLRARLALPLLAQGLASSQSVLESKLIENSDSSEQERPGPAFISDAANTDSTKIYQLSFILKDIKGKIKLKTLEVSPSLF